MNCCFPEYTFGKKKAYVFTKTSSTTNHSQTSYQKMKDITLINNTIDFVKKTLKDAEGGHDWWHIYRVW